MSSFGEKSPSRILQITTTGQTSALGLAYPAQAWRGFLLAPAQHTTRTPARFLRAETTSTMYCTTYLSHFCSLRSGLLLAYVMRNAVTTGFCRSKYHHNAALALMYEALRHPLQTCCAKFPSINLHPPHHCAFPEIMLHSIDCRFQGPYTPEVGVNAQLFMPNLDFLARLKRSFACFMLGDKA